MKPGHKRLSILLACLFLFSCGKESPRATDTADLPQARQSANGTPYFLHLSDVHLDTNSQTTQYGMDTGLELWTAAKAKIRSILESPEPPRFVIYTGDLPAHYSCTTNCYLPPDRRASHDANLQRILTDLRDLVASTRIPLFLVPGNNDGLAGDYYSFADRTQTTAFSLVPETTDRYPALNTADQCGIPPCLLSSPHPTMGYYSVRPVKGLRLIGLNTIIWGAKYSADDGVSQLNAGNVQMAWLADEMKEAAAMGEKVYLFMHIPPGLDAYGISKGAKSANLWAHLPANGMSWQDQFLTLLNQYTASVAGLLYGHTHMDELRLIYDKAGKTVMEVAVSAPGVTPQHSNNPGFKSVYFDPVTMELTDFVTYYTRPADTTWSGNTYRFSDIYGCASREILACLKDLSLDQVNTLMDFTYTVKNGSQPYETQGGIPVKFGQ